MTSADRAWFDLLGVVGRGDLVAPRGLPCFEDIAIRSVIKMTEPVVTLRGRKLGYKFMPAEAAWILSGDDRVDTIAPYSKHISSFSDDGVTFFGAYGPKVVDQLPYVVNKLIADPDSRQAVINIWRESPPETRDVPCTLSLQFLVRDLRLNVVATMRSSDVWLGWPYDVFNFSMTAAYVVLSLRDAAGDRGSYNRLQLGSLYLTAGSQHLYERDEQRMAAIRYDEDRDLRPFDLAEFTGPTDLVNHLWRVAKRQPTDRRWLAELYDW